MIKDHWIETKLGKVHIIETGNSSGKPLVLLHAAGCSAAEWYANYGALGQTYHLFAIDMPGDAGKSELRKKATGIDDYNRMLLQVLDTLYLEKVSLIGHSIGGFFATGFAMAYPEMVEKLVLLSPVATHIPIRWYLQLMLHLSGRPGMGPHAEKTLKMQAYKGFEPEHLFSELMEHVRNFCSIHLLFPYVYPERELAHIRIPTFLIVGTEEPLCHYKRSVQLARQKIPDIQVTVLENTGHTPNMERPERTNRLLLEILNT